MPSPAIATVIKMMESVPEHIQEQCVEQVRLYLEETRDELQWETAYQQTRPKLVAAAQKARREIADGFGKPMDFDQL